MTDQDDEREVDRKTKRAQKEAAELRGQADLTTKAWKAYQHVAACAARLGRVTPLYVNGKITRREFAEANRALEKAADHQLAVLWAMEDDQLKQHQETLADFQKFMSKAKVSSI